MVEANEIMQPQDKQSIKTGDEHLDMIIDLTNAKFAKLEKPVVERMEQLTDFKEIDSKKMIDLYSVLDELKEMFRKFAAEQQVKLEKLPVFFKGVEFYCNLLKFDAGGIFAQLI